MYKRDMGPVTSFISSAGSCLRSLCNCKCGCELECCECIKYKGNIDAQPGPQKIKGDATCCSGTCSFYSNSHKDITPSPSIEGQKLEK